MKYIYGKKGVWYKNQIKVGLIIIFLMERTDKGHYSAVKGPWGYKSARIVCKHYQRLSNGYNPQLFKVSAKSSKQLKRSI